MKTLKNIFLIFLFIIFIAALCYGGFSMKNTIEYSIYYKDAVKETIKEDTSPQIQSLSNKVYNLEKDIDYLIKENGFYGF